MPYNDCVAAERTIFLRYVREILHPLNTTVILPNSFEKVTCHTNKPLGKKNSV
jgi:hypothetical protein